MISDRIALFDNTKALLILLVVMGHFARYYTSFSTDMKIMFFYIYIFHMPLFIFISGLFSKSVINSSGQKLLERVLSFIILYILLKIFSFSLDKFLFSSNANFTLFSEGGFPWYLFATAIWFCITYIFKPIKPQIVIPVALIIGILVGYDSRVGDYLVASRILVYFPFFLLGYYTDVNKFLEFLNKKSLKYFAVIILLLAFLIVYTQIDYLYQFRPFLTGRHSYISANQELLGGLYRLVLYLIIVIISLSILILMPKQKTFFTFVGTRTLQIYFLHYLLLKIYHYLNINNYLQAVFPNDWLKMYIGFSVLLTIFLAMKPLERPFKKILSLKIDKISIAPLNYRS